MKLIVGLGNPGARYHKTRHNIGFEVVERFAKKHSVALDKKKFDAFLGEGTLKGERVLFCLPQTYMNLSGTSVVPLLKFYKISLSDLVVIHDELDFPLGKVKVVRQAGPAGHRGVKSIQDLLASQSFCRFRLGIQQENRVQPVVDFVLNPFAPEEQKTLEAVLEKTVTGLDIWIDQGVEAAIQFCHQKIF